MLPDILWQQGEDGDWLWRAVPNLYPIVTPPLGHHEVIIETPHHVMPAEGMTTAVWRHILAAYDARYGTLSPQWRYLSLFRNSGARSGGSLQHPHSQLIGLAHTPADVLSRHRRLRSAYRKTGRCTLCDMVDGDGHSEARLVTRSAAYAAIVPQAAQVPCEVWIVPVSHASTFGPQEGRDRDALAHILQDVFRRLNTVLGVFDYNMMLIDSERDPRPWLHWFLRVYPVLGPVGGFELATGVSVNSSNPERDAARLRDATPPADAERKNSGA